MLCRVMTWIPWIILSLASVFSVANGAYVWRQVDMGNYGLIHVKGVTSFKMHGVNWVNYWWDLVFIMVCGMLTNYLRVLDN
jgi:hypothetical protein